MKKVLLAITKGNFGGAQRYVYDIATGLPKEDFEVKVIHGEGSILEKKLSERKINSIKLENMEREISIKKEYLSVKEIVSILKKEKPDIFHLNSSKMGVLGSVCIIFLKFIRIFKKDTKIPKTIFTSHGWAFKEKKRSFLEKIIFTMGHYLTIIVCDQTIAVSYKTKEDILFLPFIKNKISIVYNGLEKIKTITKIKAREFIAGENTKKTIIYSMSELHNNKGIDLAIKAISSLPKEYRENIIYSIAGSGEEKENLEKMCRDLKIEDNVRFLGFVEDSYLYLKGANIFLMPSRTENLPYSILEAGLAGVPTIASSVGGIPEIIKDMQNGILVHPENYKEIESAILYAMNHKSKMNDFGNELKNEIENIFSYKEMIEKTINIYK